MKNPCGPLIFSFTSGSILLFALGFSAKAESGVTENQIEDKELDQVLLPKTLLDQKGDKVPAAALEGKFIGLYFSASWCGPCRAFTPSLVKFREAHKSQFEVILVGADGSPKAQANYMKKYKMPWLALTNRSREATQIRSHLEFRISLTCLFWIPIGKSSARTEERKLPARVKRHSLLGKRPRSKRRQSKSNGYPSMLHNLLGLGYRAFSEMEDTCRKHGACFALDDAVRHVRGVSDASRRNDRNFH